ncbi:monocarboxylate transporter 4-like [Cydia strobilella]|uniref:monocarboxylate transporter 4-like n=1 Tax=Cydia strobilella TaxID=1100964 RepID=UPI0030065D2D
MKTDDPIIVKSRTPRTRGHSDGVRESLLSDSTSGIDRGDASSTCSGDSFSSPDISSKDELRGRGFSKDQKNALNDLKNGKKPCNITENPQDKLKMKDVESGSAKKAKIPDGGWGWVVVASSFIISMIADGISFSFGLLYIEFLEEFGASKSTTAWIGSLFIAVPLLSGPVMSALVDRYGCRSMTILGGIISTLGFVLASVSTTIETMMLTFGVIAGLGLGLVYVTAVVSIAYWFEKKRNLAVGLGACGTGVGTFLYAPMTQYFIEEFGWRGTILLLSGTLLNLCVCGCVMRDPEWWILEQKKEKEVKPLKDVEKANQELALMPTASTKRPYKKSASLCVSDVLPLSNREMNGRVTKFKVPLMEREFHNVLHKHQKPQIYKNNKLALGWPVQELPRTESLYTIPSYLESTDRATQRVLKQLTQSPIMLTKATEIASPILGEDNDPPCVTFPKQPMRRSCSVDFYFRKEVRRSIDYQLKNPNAGRVLKKSKSETKEDRGVLIKQDSKGDRRDWLKKQLSVNHHYLKDLKMPLNSIGHRNAMLNINRYRLKASSCPDIFKNSMVTINDEEEKCYKDCLVCVSDMFNVSLFKKATFNLLCAGTILLFIWFIVPYFYLAEHMIDKGYNEDDGAVMLSLIGITNTIGMVGLGYIGDFPSVSIGNLYAACLVLCGASVAAIPPAASNYWLLGCVAAAFGLLFAASFTFTPSLLVTLVSLDDFTSAYGLVLLAQGIGHLIGPPLSGLIYDLTLSWELSFYLAGGWIVVAGVLISFIHPFRALEQRRQANQENEAT